MKLQLSINMAMTLDGKVARPDGKWYGLSSRNDKRKMDVIRSEADALIVGKNSILNDNPVIKLRYVEGKNPLPIILIRKGSLPKTKHIFQQADRKPLILCTPQNEKEIRQDLQEYAEILSLSSNEIEPKEVLSILSEKGFQKVLLEGGPTLNYAFQKEGLIDVINLTIVPFLIGQKSLPSIVTGDFPFPNFDQEKWKLVSFEKLENEIFLRYEK
ncbi:MAG TPA: RibD family protein [Leptospiraceae bacterium]|nr:RibD family protein [Leptospiraceae bacterium]HMW08236.1 RibD family protein [Leptospiraceae bacterium]HMX33974.1 RibD family protein [Leptospiraceae bacterium]HMY29663.1 RibD family protein [Leptospiraceae bacterium]HMZ66160.1 RibD family protein [Leptospiraceae bacterium]